MSEFNELIKNYNKIRDYMRDFYVYGFRTRNNFKEKSTRSYDNEKRRIENYLGEIIAFRQEESGKNVFITLSGAEIFCNPFYKSFKSASFTKNDITLHFALLYVFQKYGELTLIEIADKIFSEVICFFSNPTIIDTATIRNKLNEYASIGLVLKNNHDSRTYFKMADIPQIHDMLDAVRFFSENFPVGVIGSFILDNQKTENSIFTTKQKYILDVIDSEIILSTLKAIKQRRIATITAYGYRKKSLSKKDILPLKIAITTQSGRNYIMCYALTDKKFISIRTDAIKDISISDCEYQDFDKIHNIFCQRLSHTWGVFLGNNNVLHWLKMTIEVKEDEQYILKRLEKEGRHGKTQKLSDTTYEYYIESYELDEMRPWLRTFIGKIKKLDCSQPDYVKNFFEDIQQMKKIYTEEQS